MKIKILLRNISGNGYRIQKKNVEEILKKYKDLRVKNKKEEIEILSKEMDDIYLTFLEYLKRDFSRIVDVENPKAFLVKVER